MWAGRRAAGQLGAAGLPAGGDRVQAAGPRLHPVPRVQLLQGRLAAGAGGHPGRGEQARRAGAGVALLRALVLLAVT